jgi:hypothetical protein
MKELFDLRDQSLEILFHFLFGVKLNQQLLKLCSQSLICTS